MDVRNSWKVFFILILLVFCAAPQSFIHAQSANQQIIITWKAVGVSAPANYAGKILPSADSEIEASVAVLDGNSFLPLQGQGIYWYLDDNFIGGGIGQQTITFNAPSNNEIMTLRVQISTDNGAMNSVYIAMADPSVALVAPYPNDIFATSTISLQAVPYFFNTGDLGKLVFNWSANGNPIATTENPESLVIRLASDTPPGYSLAVSLDVQESDNPYFSAEQAVSLTRASD